MSEPARMLPRASTSPLTLIAAPLAVVVASAVGALRWGTTDTINLSGAALAACLPVLLVALCPLGWWGARRSGGAEIRFSDRAVLDRAARVDLVMLDRWGTVTTGELKASAVDPVDAGHEQNLRWFAGALGHAAGDPIGRALARLSTRGRVSGVEHVEGLGTTGSVDRHPVQYGLPHWVGVAERPGIGTQVAVKVDGRPLGYVTVADEVRPRAEASVAALRDGGLEPVLVSDDNAANTEHLAQTCGIDSWHSDSAPEKHGRLVEETRERGRVVAYTGSHHEPLGAADVAIRVAGDTSSPGASGIEMIDLDVERVVRALAIACASAAASRRSRIVGIACTTALLGLTVSGVVGLVPTLIASALAAGATAVSGLAMRV
ncbi:HAD family hydrolase [Nocardioides sp. BGMRC 2183]|nr:HAD family hydrolase [Nocardioides sp. BGMRC 2183]